MNVGLARRLAGVAVAVVGATSLAGCSLILDFDNPVVDGGQAFPDACLGENVDAALLMEPNEDFSQAVAISPGTLMLELNPTADEDYFSFNVTAATSIGVTATNLGCGDLDLELYKDMTLVAASRRSGERPESISLSASEVEAAGLGPYFIHVFQFNHEAVSAYELVFELGN